MPNISPKPNRFYPSVPEISEEPASHTLALQTIKDALQTHERRDSNYLKSFIRFEELVDLGIIDASGEFILDLGDNGDNGGEGGATELDELTDVTISALADNKMLGYDSTSTQWIPQTAAELNLSEVGHTHPPNVGDLNDLGDVDLSGSADYDLLFRTGGIWEATKGLLQWDGADLHIASGDLRFYAVGDAVTSALRQNFPAGGDLGVQVPSGDFVIQTGQAVRVQPGTDFYVQNANLYMNISEGVRWTHGAGSNEFLGFEEVGQASTPTNFVVHETFIDSFTTSQTYVDTDNGLDQAQNVFGDGDEILIVHQALLYNNTSNAADSNGYQIIADGVVLDGSEQLGEGLGASRPREAANPYGYVGFFTADIAGANVKTQLKRGSGGTEYVCSAEGGFMLNLTHSVPNHVKDSSLAGTDVSKFGTGTGLTWVLTDTAVTLEAGSYILYIGARYDNMSGAAATPTGGFNDGTTDLELFGRTLEDSATDQMSFGGTYYLEDYAGGTVTVIGRANNIVTGCIMDYVCIVAIPLSDFANSWAVQQDDTELFLAAEDTDEVINTINIASIPTTANYLALAWGQYEYAGTQLSTCSEILENVDSGGDTLIGWDNLYTLRKTTALTGDQQNINSSVRTYTAGEQVDIKQNAINYNAGFGTQSHKNHGLALLEMNTVESLGGTLYVGDPGFITHIDGTLIEFENTIGLNWANAAGLNIELVVLNDVVDPFDDTTTDSIPFTGTDTDTTYTSPGGNVFTFFANAEISTDQFFDAPSSLYLDGASSYVSCANADFLPGTEDFTIEAMVYNLDTFQGPIMGIYTNGTDASWRFWLDTNRQCEVNFYTDVDGINVLEGPILQVVQDQWQHWCLERVDTVVSLYLDGVLQDSTVITSGASLNDSSGPPTTPMRIGSVGASINYMNGYVDNLRVTIGSVRYGAPFTPPTSFESTAFSEFVLGDPAYTTRVDGMVDHTMSGVLTLTSPSYSWNINANETWGTLDIAGNDPWNNEFGIMLDTGGVIYVGGGVPVQAVPNFPALGDEFSNSFEILSGDIDSSIIAEIGFYGDDLFQTGNIVDNAPFGLYITKPGNDFRYPLVFDAENELMYLGGFPVRFASANTAWGGGTAGSSNMLYGANFVEFDHDDTDFNIAATNTTDLNISGFATIQIQGAHFRIESPNAVRGLDWEQTNAGDVWVTGTGYTGSGGSWFLYRVGQIGIYDRDFAGASPPVAAETPNAQWSMWNGADEPIGRWGYNNSSTLLIENFHHGGKHLFTGENNIGTSVTLLDFDPQAATVDSDAAWSIEGSLTINNTADGSEVKIEQTDTIIAVTGDLVNSYGIQFIDIDDVGIRQTGTVSNPPVEADTPSGSFSIWDVNFNLMMFFGYAGTSELRLGSEVRGGHVRVFGTNSTGTERDFLEGDPNGPTTALGNFVFDIDQAVGAGQDNFVLTYDDASGEIALEVATTGPPVTATTTELEDIANAINTDPDKVAGYQVFNTTTGAPVWAVGAADGSVWNDATGTLAHTPVV